MAAFTRSGARKASEIVMLTFRTLHRSRLAMLSALAFASARSSASQRRPRAIDATRSARDSDRIGRAYCGGVPAGRRISRRRVDGGLCHRTLRMLSPLVLRRSGVFAWARRMTNCSGWTSTRATWVLMRLRSSTGAAGLRCSRTDLTTSASMSAAATRRTDPAPPAMPWSRADDR